MPALKLRNFFSDLFQAGNKSQCHFRLGLEKCVVSSKSSAFFPTMRLSIDVIFFTISFGCSFGSPQPPEDRSDLSQGCTPQELLDLDKENVACYKKVITLKLFDSFCTLTIIIFLRLILK